MIKKGDIFLFIFIVIIGLASFFLVSKSTINKGVKASIFINQKLYGKYSLEEDEILNINNNGKKNKIKIVKGKIGIIDSNCENKNCIKEGYKFKENETIVCLPHKLIINIEVGEGNIDAISN